MRDLVYFVAASLDGYIAGKNGAIDWLFADSDYGYRRFLRSIDTVLMGRKTFELALSFGEYPYPDKEGYVFSRSKRVSPVLSARYVREAPVALAARLKRQPGKKIWLVGGFEIASGLFKKKLIDELVLSIHPILLGAGIRLFPKLPDRQSWVLRAAKKYPSGLVQAIYRLGKRHGRKPRSEGAGYGKGPDQVLGSPKRQSKRHPGESRGPF